MTLPITISSPLSAGASPASDDSTQPRTPVSPTSQSVTINNNNSNNDSSNNSNNANKRKPSRRANTAERRATHNAVERQRRETLNGRFLDLAALLPNLSQIRRPSKSSIVNSSIAHIHASRRHRLLASRELRLLKLESDALRREINEWRDRAGIPRVEEPVRGEGFSMILSGELEVLPIGGGLGMVEGMDGIDEEDGDYGYDEPESGAVGAPEEMYRQDDVATGAMGPVPTMHPHQHPQMMQRAVPTQAHPMRAPHPQNVQDRMERLKRLERLDRLDRSGPMIASPTSMSFDSPAVPGMYEPRIEPQMQHMGMGNMGMMQQMPGQMMGMGFEQSGKFSNPNNGVAMRARSASMSGSSSGSASPPLHGHGGYPSHPSPEVQQGEWMQMQSMGVHGHGAHVNQGMIVGGMGGMNPAGVAFAMMM
ncbi:hypothetical protein VKT23_007545 [Stygiomarasmius scandens]|uniref:BHLH domain-containing protein n=1 Tax=Marasmiellus scandens TaxID=2682957 RepID=A0ABR1JMP3_9AGAR